MRILHQSDLCTVALGDARDPNTRPGWYDLLCTDPPYGVRWKSGFRTDKFDEILGDDGSLDVPEALGQWARKLRMNRHAYVFGFRPDQLTEPMGFGGTAELIWDKGQLGPGNLSLPWGPQHEPITFGVRSSRKPSKGTGSGNLAARLRQGSVLRVPRIGGTRVNRHPTEKPLPLMSELIESSSRRGDPVVDPFTGVGSTLVAAILSGRRAWGVELEERYAMIAVDRVRRAEEIARIIAAA